MVCEALAINSVESFGRVFDWVIRFAHPVGAIFRMFSALRAPSDLHRDDVEGNGDRAKQKRRDLAAALLLEIALGYQRITTAQ
jgi:hypothetical protein